MIDALVDGLLVMLIVVVLLGYPALLWWMGHGFIWPIDRAVRVDLRRARHRLQNALRAQSPARSR
jgi:hypothetical protein